MKIIELQNLYEEPDKIYNVFSTVIFRLEDPYRESINYYNGLKKIVNLFPETFPGDYLRIYFDTSITDNFISEQQKEETQNIWIPFFEELKKKDYIQLVKYNIPKYRKNDVFHEGLIGTIIRFVPFFDIPENKKLDIVTCIDVDINDYEIINLKKHYELFKKLREKNDVEFMYRSFGCYHNIKRYIDMKKFFDIVHPIVANEIIGCYKFPVRLLTEFFRCISKPCKYYSYFIQTTKIDNRNISVNKFPYGIDEIFCLIMRRYLVNYEIPHVKIVKEEIVQVLRKIVENYNENKINEELTKELIKQFLGKYYNDKKSLKNNIKNLMFVNRFENWNNNPKYFYIKNHILLNSKKLMKDLKVDKKYKKYGLEMIDIDCILEQPLTEKYYIIK
jgi:hypothetical protein